MSLLPIDHMLELTEVDVLENKVSFDCGSVENSASLDDGRLAKQMSVDPD